MSIDTIVKNADLKLGKCFINGIYHYRSLDKKEKKSYCAMSEDSCPLYYKKGNHEYCKKNDFR